jgi:hypothetical protein
MRESQMKKIIALAVASAFAVPVMAADITISGSQEFSWADGNGSSTSDVDGLFKVVASDELANGMTVSADIIISEEGTADGGTSLTFGGEFGTVDLGDTSGAIDAIDDKTDFGLAATSGTGGTDANALWTLPALADGLTINVSASANSQTGAGQDAETEATGVSVQYATGMFSVGYGTQDNDDGSSHTLVNGTVTMNGFTVAVESFTDTTAASVDTDTEALGVKYAMGDITLFAENVETSSTGTVSADVTAMGVHYAMGPVTFFAEQKDDSKDASVETTYFGASYSF